MEKTTDEMIAEIEALLNSPDEPLPSEEVRGAPTHRHEEAEYDASARSESPQIPPMTPDEPTQRERVLREFAIVRSSHSRWFTDEELVSRGWSQADIASVKAEKYRWIGPSELKKERGWTKEDIALFLGKPHYTPRAVRRFKTVGLYRRDIVLDIENSEGWQTRPCVVAPMLREAGLSIQRIAEHVAVSHYQAKQLCKHVTPDNPMAEPQMDDDLAESNAIDALREGVILTKVVKEYGIQPNRLESLAEKHGITIREPVKKHKHAPSWDKYYLM